jgi:hypothetical protein
VLGVLARGEPAAGNTSGMGLTLIRARCACLDRADIGVWGDVQAANADVSSLHWKLATALVSVPVMKGKHTFQVQAIDQAGNVSAPAIETWKRKSGRTSRTPPAYSESPAASRAASGSL